MYWKVKEMIMKRYLLFILLGSFGLFSSCESEYDKKKRLALEQQQRIELEEKRIQDEQEKEIYDALLQNSLATGSTPYAYCYGKANSCNSSGCSELKVKTPSNSDVLVTIKRNNEVYRHAYIRAGGSFTFQLPNGTYQPFFYYGKGWNPEKIMKETSCGTLKGGFVAEEHVGKDSPQNLYNDILGYELILQQNGNFSTQVSNPQEAL